MAVSYADLSHYQGSVDLAAYKAAGHDRVMLKATEGTGFLDTTFTARWRQAGTLGLKRGAYHFLRNALPGAEQWAWFIAAVRRAGPLQPGDWLCLDSEDPATPGRAVACSQEFTRAATLAGHVDGEVYTGRWYADPNGLTAAVFPVGWRRLWLSDYTPAQVALPAGWAQTQLVALQYTDKATVGGVGGTCDYNRVLNDWHTTEDDMPLTPAEANLLAQAAADAKAARAAAESADARTKRIHEVTLAVSGGREVQTLAELTELAGRIAAVGAQVGAQADDEAKLVAALTGAEARIIAAAGAVAGNPSVDNDDPDAVVAAFRDALIAGTTKPAVPPG